MTDQTSQENQVNWTKQMYDDIGLWMSLLWAPSQWLNSQYNFSPPWAYRESSWGVIYHWYHLESLWKHSRIISCAPTIGSFRPSLVAMKPVNGVRLGQGCTIWGLQPEPPVSKSHDNLFEFMLYVKRYSNLPIRWLARLNNSKWWLRFETPL